MAKKTTKRSLLLSIMAMIFTFTMLLGTTFAWFTDSVTSTGNIIKTGTLDVTLEYTDEYAASVDEMDWQDASKGAIFNYKNWEPGYTDVKYIKVENVGSLGLKFQLNILPNVIPAEDEVNLADVIDVFMVTHEELQGTALTKQTLSAVTPRATLSSLMNDVDGAAYGTLPKESEIVVAIALKMQETAGNEYQNLSVGDGFSVQLLATQAETESDSFDATYDTSAQFQEVAVASVTKLPLKNASAPMEDRTILSTEWNSYSPISGKDIVLDTGYRFEAPLTADEAADSKYADWHGDFVISFDKSVPVGAVGLAGNYENPWTNGQWIGFANEGQFEINIPAGMEIRLLRDGMGLAISYEEICTLTTQPGKLQGFLCGAWANSIYADGITMTVELRLFEATGGAIDTETGKSITIGQYSHTFDVAGVAERPDANATVITDQYADPSAYTWNNSSPVKTPLEVVYQFTAPDTAATIADSPYKDWGCDFFVSMDKDIAAEEIILGGYYQGFDWIAFANPDPVQANEFVPLLGSVTVNDWTYENIATLVGEFRCGVADNPNDSTDLAGATFTVELRVYNIAQPAEYFVIECIQYTF